MRMTAGSRCQLVVPGIGLGAPVSLGVRVRDRAFGPGHAFVARGLASPNILFIFIRRTVIDAGCGRAQRPAPPLSLVLGWLHVVDLGPPLMS